MNVGYNPHARRQNEMYTGGTKERTRSTNKYDNPTEVCNLLLRKCHERVSSLFNGKSKATECSVIRDEKAYILELVLKIPLRRRDVLMAKLNGFCLPNFLQVIPVALNHLNTYINVTQYITFLVL